jgi:hypothetical protein
MDSKLLCESTDLIQQEIEQSIYRGYTGYCQWCGAYDESRKPIFYLEVYKLSFKRWDSYIVCMGCAVAARKAYKDTGIEYSLKLIERVDLDRDD